MKVNSSLGIWCYSNTVSIRVHPLQYKRYFFLVNDTEICNYADDTTLYVGEKNPKAVLSKLEKDTLYCQNGSLII